MPYSSPAASCQPADVRTSTKVWMSQPIAFHLFPVLYNHHDTAVHLASEPLFGLDPFSEREDLVDLRVVVADLHGAGGHLDGVLDYLSVRGITDAGEHPQGQ